MTMPALPGLGTTSWHPWATAVHEAAEAVTDGRLTEEALGAAFVPVARVSDGGLFVAPDGNDADNDGLSLGRPMKTITAAIDKAVTAGVGAEISLAPGEHPYGATDGYQGSSTIRLVDNIHLHGITSGQSSGTVIRRTVDDGEPMFDSNPGAPLSGCIVEDLHIITNLGVKPTGDGTSHGLDLYCLTNNSAIRRVAGQRLRGDVLHLRPNVTTGDTLHGVFNAMIEQIFGIACGGYVIGAEGISVGTLAMPDGTNMVGGLVNIQGGISNQAALVILQPMWEGATAGTAQVPVLVNNANSQPIVIVGGSFFGQTGTPDVVKVTGTGASAVSLIGCSGTNFTNWINDTVASFSLPMTTRITYLDNATGNQLRAQAPGAIIENYDTAGTANQRRWRWRQSGSLFILSERDDAGANVRDILIINGTNGQVEVVNALKVTGNVGFYGATPIAKRAATPDATDLATAITLVNALKADLVAYGLKAP